MIKSIEISQKRNTVEKSVRKIAKNNSRRFTELERKE